MTRTWPRFGFNGWWPEGLTDAYPVSFVLCPSFHGATLLSLLLDCHSDIVALGDTNPLRSGADCSCGLRTTECAFWTELSTEASAGHFPRSAQLLPPVPQLVSHARANRQLNAAFAIGGICLSPRVWRPVAQDVREYVEAWEAFRRFVLHTAGARVFVDGEKNALKAMVAMGLGGRDVNVLHLTRDPRGYVHSYRQRNQMLTPSEGAEDWVRSHRRILWVSRFLERGRYLHLRYEDLATAPAEAMSRVQEFLGLEGDSSRQDIASPQSHHLIGNRMLRQFSGTISNDEAWMALPQSEQKSIRAATEPLFSRFGYTERPR